MVCLPNELQTVGRHIKSLPGRHGTKVENLHTLDFLPIVW